MPPFRDRPVTYLFLGATVAIDAALAAAELSRGPRALAMGFVIGQMLLSGIWLALGSMHRLVRGTTLVLAAGVLSTLFVVLRDGSVPSTQWHRVVAAAFLLQMSVAVVAGVANYAFGIRRHPPSADEESRWRFPVVELFGWTIVVAASSWLLREVQFEHVQRNPRAVLAWMLLCIVMGVSGASLRQKTPGKRELVASTMVILAFAVSCFFLHGDYHAMELRMQLVALSYVVAFCVCRRLDESLKQRANELGEEESTSE